METRLGHRHVMIYQRNIMGTSIYHNMSGENPATVSPAWEGDWGREEGEGEQERV